jgi:hypothetical protein
MPTETTERAGQTQAEDHLTCLGDSRSRLGCAETRLVLDAPFLGVFRTTYQAPSELSLSSCGHNSLNLVIPQGRFTL